MKRNLKISDIQADILMTALDTGEHEGERIPFAVLHVPPDWSGPLSGLIRRELLKLRKRNMYDVTREGEEALKKWSEEVPAIKTY